MDEQLDKSNYQTYILFLSWTIGLLGVILNLFVKIELSRIILIVVFIDIILNFRRNNPKINRLSYHVFFLIIIFYGWLIFSMAYSPSLDYKYEKTFNFVANIIFFMYPFFIKKINFDLLIRLYCIIILPLSAYFVYMLSIVWKVQSAETVLFMDIRGSYLTVGLQLGIIFLLLIYFNKSIILKIITLFLLLATSARGPLLFTVLTTFIFLFSKNIIYLLKPKNIFSLIIGCFGFFIIYSLKANTINSLLETTFMRFGSLTEGNDGSALERVHRLKLAFYQPFEKLTTFLFGNGIGSFGILYENKDIRSYPHNILLESFFELGIVGFSIFLILFLTIFSKMSLKKNVFGLLFIFTFMNAMKSSNITDLWILFSLMGGIISLYAIPFENNINRLKI